MRGTCCQLVIDEASAGDPSAAADRLQLLDGLSTVPIDDDFRALARAIVSASIMPAKAADDALHVAAAAVAGVQYLLTLHCKHIANAHELPRVYRLLDDHGYGQAPQLGPQRQALAKHMGQAAKFYYEQLKRSENAVRRLF